MRCEGAFWGLVVMLLLVDFFESEYRCQISPVGVSVSRVGNMVSLGR